jgi:hypothetical protein
MSDPNTEIRERRTSHTEYLERVQLRLSPTDDDLPRGMAIRFKAEMEQACHAFAEKVAKRVKR